MTSIAANTATAASTAASSTASSSTIMGDFNTFLTMLTTQLKNQDPSTPMDSNELTQQLVQFAGIEQQMAANTTLTSLLQLQQSAQLTASAPLLGQSVEVESSALTVQDGKAELMLPKAGTATQAQITISDSSGKTLHSETVSLGTKPGTWDWDAKDTAGNAVSDGAYKVTVTGLTNSGSASSIDFTVVGRATSAAMNDSTLQLMLGGLAVNFDKIRGIAEAEN